MCVRAHVCGRVRACVFFPYVFILWWLHCNARTHPSPNAVSVSTLPACSLSHLQVGPGVRGLSPGDRVVSLHWASCGTCTPCQYVCRMIILLQIFNIQDTIDDLSSFLFFFFFLFLFLSRSLWLAYYIYMYIFVTVTISAIEILFTPYIPNSPILINA